MTSVAPRSPATDGLNPNAWQGILNLTYERRGPKTQVVDSFSQAPFKIQSPFYPEGPEICHTIALHTAGGMVGGDRLEQNIILQPQSHSVITTTTAGKVYRSNGHTARQLVKITVRSQSCLEYLPQELILFNGGKFHQDMTINLEAGAHVVLWDVVRFGRSARGEIFNQGQWSNFTEVYQGGIPIWGDRSRFQGSDENFASPNLLNRQPVIGTLVFLGQDATELLNPVRSQWAQQSLRGEIGITTLVNGLLCRYRGPSSAEAKRLFSQLWAQLRPLYGKKPPVLPRVWL